MVGAKLKIGLVIDTDLDAPDGVQQYVLTLGRWLSSQGHEVRYLAGETHRQDLPGLYSLARNIRVHFNGNSLTIPLPARLGLIKKILRDERFDVLHVQTPHSPFMAQKVVLGADLGTAVIGTFHILPLGWPSRLGNRLLGWGLRPSLKRFDEIVSVSPAAADFALSTFGVKTSVVPNMTDLEPLKNAKPLPEYDDDLITILFLGRLVPRKGSLTLLKAVAELRRRPDLPKFRVVICGQGQLLCQLQKFINEHDLQDTVTLTGFVSEQAKPNYYASADIAVFPSLGGESFGIVLLEAMASGRSLVLAADNPGYRSVMAGLEELLFDPTSARALAQKLAYYLTNDKERQALKGRSHLHVQQFDTQVVGSKLLARYYQALRKRPSA